MFQVKMPAVRRKCCYQNAGGGILYFRHFHLHSTKLAPVCKLTPARTLLHVKGVISEFAKPPSLI